MKRLSTGFYDIDVIDDLEYIDQTPDDDRVYTITDEDYAMLCLKHGDMSGGLDMVTE